MRLVGLGFDASAMGIVFLENDDSFSWNVVDRLPFERVDIAIVSSPDEAMALLHRAEALVIGPGPRDPVRAGLVRVVRLAAETGIPTLGICLGHQAIGLAFGARLIRTEPAHGIRSEVVFRGARRFPTFEGPVEVMRYHSLSLTDIPFPLRVVAATPSGIPMAVEHESLPIAGLQFHPDSFGTRRGSEMLRSFFVSATPGRLA